VPSAHRRIGSAADGEQPHPPPARDGTQAAGFRAPLAAARLTAASRVVALRAASTDSTYSVATEGEDLEMRMKFSTGGAPISPWHDIPLDAGDGLLNFICEIPKETSAKMEVATDEPKNPIKQDTKKGKLRFYPYNINWNYGLLPQTWEDPAVAHPELEVMGDNDPVDVVEVGSTQLEMGGVYKVKPIGCLAMIDDGELDWKVITISVDDPKAAAINDVEDLEREMPGEIEKILVWFRDYKIPDGKPANAFGYDNKCMDKAFTLDVIAETSEFYQALKSGKRPNDEELALS